MLVIKENKIKTASGVLITEEVYMRIAFTTRFGENSDTQPATHVKAWLQYTAYTKTKFLKSGINAPYLTIEGLISEIIVDIIKTENYGWIEFNEIFKKYIIDTLCLTIEDISIIPL